jgi:hypothetical protein
VASPGGPRAAPAGPYCVPGMVPWDMRVRGVVLYAPSLGVCAMGLHRVNLKLHCATRWDPSSLAIGSLVPCDFGLEEGGARVVDAEVRVCEVRGWCHTPPPPLAALPHSGLPVQRCPASDWVHGKGDSEFDVVQTLLRQALPVIDAWPTLPVLPALVYRDFELLRYGVGAFFAEHADR